LTSEQDEDKINDHGNCNHHKFEEKMKRKLYLMTATIILLLSSTLTVIAKQNLTHHHPTVTIGIVAPIQIPAMNEIIDGFKYQLNNSYPGHVDYVIKNAQGDENIQRSILQQFNDMPLTVVAPIGTQTSQMAMTIVRDKPIIAIAADYDRNDVISAHNHNVTHVIDDPSPAKQFKFIHDALPKIHHITVVHSNNQRILDSVKQLKIVAKKYGITIQDLMMQQLSDIYSISRSISHNSQAIFIFQDEFVVNGITALVEQAEHKGITVIASDDGSVQKGAAFSIGVSQRQIGMDGAKLALKVLQGIPASRLVPIHINQYTVYINSEAAKKQNINVNVLKKVAKHFGYPIIIYQHPIQ